MSEFTGRRQARIDAIEILYRHDLLDDPVEVLTAETLERRRRKKHAAEYCQRLVQTVVAHLAEIDQELTQTLRHWRLDRLSYLDRAILRLACCELLFFADVPAVVSICEAVELAKRFGDERSAQFVNGVLDSIAQRCRGLSKSSGPGKGESTTSTSDQT